ncbi:MAG TPA: RagB/SusD family nutrient uptake outer membrane protein [Gemmatimonadaceae bacterium]|nr:RagB/SusD family nutrient uptake outer membrane protein [Gemmatimonadaceae bacterium]
MMTWNQMSGRAPRRGRRTRMHWVAMTAAVLSVAASVTACNTDQLLDVNAPDRVPAETLDDPSQAALIVNGAVADFECAYASYDLAQAIMSDEFSDAQLGAASWSYDRRDFSSSPGGIFGENGCTSSQNPGIYVPLSTARWQADNALTKLQGWTDEEVGSNRTSLIATSALYAGFSYSTMGMIMCSAAFDLQAPVDQQAMFALAEDRFTTAIEAATQAGGMDDVINAALVGRARVRLFQGNTAGAIADAELVPAGFEYDATYAADQERRYNRVYSATTQFGLYTVAPESRGIETEGAEDPRSKTELKPTNASDPAEDIWAPTKYTGDESPIRIASYDEARLILAEAKGGSDAVSIINDLRGDYGVTAYSGPTDAASIQALIAHERRVTLFAEGFRQYDIQRFQIPQVPAPGTPFPKGGFYGTTTCLPLPDIERFNNPNAG